MAAYPEHCDVLEGVLNNCCTRTKDVYSALPSKCYQSVSPVMPTGKKESGDLLLM